MMERILTLLAAACVLLLLAIVAGCTRTVYVDRPVEHRVEVSRPCLEPGDIPGPQLYAMSRLAKGASDGEIILAMREEIAERTDTEALLRGLLTSCVPRADTP